MTHAAASALVRTFQLSELIPRRRAIEIAAALEDLWELATGAAPADFTDDLERLRKLFFDPVSQGKRLRDQLGLLPAAPVGVQLADALAIPAGEGRLLVTPEGRGALELVRNGLSKSTVAEVRLDTELAADLEHILLNSYRDWSRHRIGQVIGLLGDEGLRPPVIGLMLTMLVNRSVGSSRAIRRYPEGGERDAVDEAFRAPAAAFAQVVDPGSHRSHLKERLVSGWTLHEVTRRYPAAIVIDEVDGIGRVYIAEGQEPVLLDAAVRALGRKHIGQGTTERAFDALVEALRSEQQRLSGYAMYFERASETRRLKDALLESLQRHRDRRSAE